VALPKVKSAIPGLRTQNSHNTRRAPKPGPQKRPALIHGGGFTREFGVAAEQKRAECMIAGLAHIAATEAIEIVTLNARPFLERRMLSQCAWPIGEGLSMQSCCNPIARGSYCEGHGQIAYSNAAPRRNYSTAKATASFTRHDRTRPSEAVDAEPEPLWGIAA
jgi:hypothetical protein